MIRIAKLAAAFALYATMAVAGEDKKADAKPTVDVAHTVDFTSKVKAIDQKTRVVTLVGQGGEEVTFTADKRVKNLSQLKVGDVVTVKLEESLKARVLDPGTPIPESSQTSSLTTAPLGAKPAGHQKSDVYIVGTVTAIDVPNMIVTLKGAKGETWPVKARSKANLEKLKVGDIVEIRATKSLAVAVSEPK